MDSPSVGGRGAGFDGPAFDMRALLILMCLVFCSAPTCLAAQELSEYSGVDKVWSQAQEYSVEPEETLEKGLGNLFRDIQNSLSGYIQRSMKTGIKILAVVILCGFAEGACIQKTALAASKMAGALAVTALSVSDIQVMIGLGRETIGKMEDFSNVLLPVMAFLTAATGQINLASARQGATILFSRLLLGVIDGVLIPLVYAYIAACCACAAVGNDGLKKISGILKSTVQMVLSALLLAFVGYLSMGGAVAGSADAAAVKTAKMAISRAIPVVGGILADAAESVLIGADLLRSTVGVVGLLVVLTICMGPFLQLGFHYLTYKLAAALTGTVADPRLSGLLDQIGGAFGLVLGMTGACALLLLISLVSAVTAVTV